MTQLAIVTPLLDIGRSLRESSLMFWETLWALVLGFSLSGAVQAYVSKERMQQKLGNHRPAAVGRAASYGVVSSSCSYAASAMSKSLFAKGADFVTALVFMVASTNLVIELGIVILVLLGWQFMAAEFIGGPIMILVVALGGGLVFAKPLVESARRRLAERGSGGGDPPAMDHEVAPPRYVPVGSGRWPKLRSPAALSDAASYAIADATMLRRELFIGYGVAGFLAVLVPTDAWNALFVHGHGFWTIIENALVGPIIAVASCVCSIGNVPLAAALWFGGISFGGVIAFIFADLIALPLILVYRKLYGAELALRVVGLLYVAMVTAGLLTEGIFGLLGAIPTTRTIHATPAQFAWNYTAYLNIVFVGVAAGVWWLAHNRARLGGGRGYAIDPVCGMQVRVADAVAQASFGGRDYRFCSDRCRERFEESPTRYATAGEPRVAISPSGSREASQISRPATDRPLTSVDPICGMTVDLSAAPIRRRLDGVDYWFCSQGCAETFEAQQPRDVSRSSIPNERHD